MCLGTIDSVSAWNHAEAISPLTTNVCMTCYETFSFKCYVEQNNMCHKQLWRHFQQCPLEIGWIEGGGLVHPKGVNGMATSGLGYENLTTTIPILSANGPRKTVILPCIYYQLQLFSKV